MELNRKELFTIDDVESITGQDLTGRIVVVKPQRLSEHYRIPEYQLWVANGGFGCKAELSGRAVFATCLADKEDARWGRYDFLGILKDKVAKELNIKVGIVEA